MFQFAVSPNVLHMKEVDSKCILLTQMHHKSQIQVHSRGNPAKYLSIPVESRNICFHPRVNPATLASIAAGNPRVPLDFRDPHPHAGL